jgi:RNA polymerase sigma-70 factor (ECF subfamily)
MRNGHGLTTHVAGFAELYQTHGPRMKSLAYNLLHNRSDAEDAVQETFLKAFHAQTGFRGGAALSTWLYRILINTCYDIGRRRTSRRDKDTVALDAANELTTPVHDHPLRITLERLVGDLPPRMREVFLLYEVEGLTHREVADVLEIAEGTSKSTLADAKRRIASALRHERAFAGKES